MVDNKDIHGSDAVKQTTKRKQMKDAQFQNFCNSTLQQIRNNWIFKENGIIFAENFNLIPIERSLNCKIELSKNNIVNTHDSNNNYDRNYANTYKNLSSHALVLTKEVNNWAVVYESSSSGMHNQVQAMVEKMTKNLARY